MSDWQVCLQVESDGVRLLVTDGERGDLVKAFLPVSPSHPRALLTLLEGLALWAGQRLEPAVFVVNDCRRTLESEVFGDGVWPAESGSVRFRFVGPARRRRAEGLGRFGALRALHSRGRSWR